MTMGAARACKRMKQSNLWLSDSAAVPAITPQQLASVSEAASITSFSSGLNLSATLFCTGADN